MDANANAGGGTGDAPEPTEAELNDLQQFIDSGNLEHLDNMGRDSILQLSLQFCIVQNNFSFMSQSLHLASYYY